MQRRGINYTSTNKTVLRPRHRKIMRTEVDLKGRHIRVYDVDYIQEEMVKLTDELKLHYGELFGEEFLVTFETSKKPRKTEESYQLRGIRSELGRINNALRVATPEGALAYLGGESPGFHVFKNGEWEKVNRTLSDSDNKLEELTKRVEALEEKQEEEETRKKAIEALKNQW